MVSQSQPRALEQSWLHDRGNSVLQAMSACTVGTMGLLFERPLPISTADAVAFDGYGHRGETNTYLYIPECKLHIVYTSLLLLLLLCTVLVRSTTQRIGNTSV